MEIVIKACAAALCSSTICLLIKKSNPEMSLLLGTVTAVMITAAAIALSEPIADLYEMMRKNSEIHDVYAVPVLKCTGIGITVKLAVDICREASQPAAASALELAGTVCALAAAMPLINSLITTVCEFV